MSETVSAEAAESLKNPYWEMDSRSPEWVWYPEVLDRFGPIEEWTDEDWEDAEHLQMSEWRRRHPWPEDSWVSWEDAKHVLAERLERMNTPESEEALREIFPDR